VNIRPKVLKTNIAAIKRWYEFGDQRDLDQVHKEHWRWIEGFAWGYRGSYPSVSFKDIKQAAHEGFLEVLDRRKKRYNPDSGNELNTYARWYIQKHIVNKLGEVELKRGVKGINLDNHTIDVASGSEPLYEDADGEDDAGGETLGDTLRDTASVVERGDNWLSSLHPKLRDVVRAYDEWGLTFDEIGERYGLTGWGANKRYIKAKSELASEAFVGDLTKPDSLSPRDIAAAARPHPLVPINTVMAALYFPWRFTPKRHPVAEHDYLCQVLDLLAEHAIYRQVGVGYLRRRRHNSGECPPDIQRKLKAGSEWTGKWKQLANGNRKLIWKVPSAPKVEQLGIFHHRGRPLLISASDGVWNKRPAKRDTRLKPVTQAEIEAEARYNAAFGDRSKIKHGSVYYDPQNPPRCECLGLHDKWKDLTFRAGRVDEFDVDVETAAEKAAEKRSDKLAYGKKKKGSRPGKGWRKLGKSGCYSNLRLPKPTVISTAEPRWPVGPRTGDYRAVRLEANPKPFKHIRPNGETLIWKGTRSACGGSTTIDRSKMFKPEALPLPGCIPDACIQVAWDIAGHRRALPFGGVAWRATTVLRVVPAPGSTKRMSHLRPPQPRDFGRDNDLWKHFPSRFDLERFMVSTAGNFGSSPYFVPMPYAPPTKHRDTIIRPMPRKRPLGECGEMAQRLMALTKHPDGSAPPKAAVIRFPASSRQSRGLQEEVVGPLSPGRSSGIRAPSSG
jgi:RNA polymerase sigma factor (sigma-70 family)